MLRIAHVDSSVKKEMMHMSQGVSKSLPTFHLMDGPVTVSSIAFFRGVQAGYQAYQDEQTPLSEHDLYERLVHRLLALPDSTSANIGWVIGWVKGLLEEASPSVSHVSVASRGRRCEEPAPYGDNFIPVIPNDNQLHSVNNPYCYDPSCPCHQDRTCVLETAQAVKEGLMTPNEAINYIRGKHI